MRGDIADPDVVREAMDGCDGVVNFAAETHVDRSLLGDASFIETDVAGVFVLLEEARRRGVRKFIQISTDEVYGSIAEGSFTEESPLNPRNPYAASKAGGDRLAYSYWASYGMPVVITRASNNYGPYQYPEKLIPLFVTNAIDGLPLPLYGDGRNVRDWLYVRDHAAAIDFLLDAGEPGETYNIAGGNEAENIEITRRVLAAARQAREPDPLRRRPAGPRPALLARRLQARAARLPPATPFDEGLAETVAGTATTRSGGGRSRSTTPRTASSTAAVRRAPGDLVGDRQGAGIARAARSEIGAVLRTPLGRLPSETAERGASSPAVRRARAAPSGAAHSRHGRRRECSARTWLRCSPAAGHEVLARPRSELDITDATAVARAFREIRPTVVVNCAAFTRVDDCETDPARFRGERRRRRDRLADACGRYAAQLVQISTDFVFDGAKAAPYAERTSPTRCRRTAAASAPGKRRRCACPAASSCAPPGSSGAAGWNFIEAILKQVEAGKARAVGRRRPDRPPDRDDRPLRGDPGPARGRGGRDLPLRQSRRSHLVRVRARDPELSRARRRRASRRRRRRRSAVRRGGRPTPCWTRRSTRG